MMTASLPSTSSSRDSSSRRASPSSMASCPLSRVVPPPGWSASFRGAVSGTSPRSPRPSARITPPPSAMPHSPAASSSSARRVSSWQSITGPLITNLPQSKRSRACSQPPKGSSRRVPVPSSRRGPPCARPMSATSRSMSSAARRFARRSPAPRSLALTYPESRCPATTRQVHSFASSAPRTCRATSRSHQVSSRSSARGRRRLACSRARAMPSARTGGSTC